MMMEIGDIKKVASRKRINTDVEKLREKVSRETAKIIKLKVAQDTAYWDLKEKLQQVENNHERLQQNMVEVQMQHEAISGQYQDELRLRPETLNKLCGTREICDVLEDYSERLKDTLSRCKADQGALYEAYQKSGQLVRELKGKQEQTDERNRQLIERLQEKVNASKEHQGQLLQYLTAAKQQAENELANARRQSEQIMSENAQLQRDLDKQTNNLALKDEMVTNLREELKRATEDYNAHYAEAKNTIIKLENEIRAAKEAYNTVKAELNAQEELVRATVHERDAFKGTLATLEEAQAELFTANKTLEAQLKEASTSKAIIEQNYEKVAEERNRLEKEIFDYIQQLTNVKQQAHELEIQLSNIEKQKLDIVSELDKILEELKLKDVKIEELITQEGLLKEKINEIDNAFKSHRETTETEISKFKETLKEKEEEIDSKTDTVNLLMSEVKIGTDARSRLEGSLQKVKKDLEMEKESGLERERKMGKQIELLETSVRDKQDELSKQMSIILDMRNEKERLQEKIQGMQQTIDNIQKELTGRAPPPHSDPPEMDDNAVMLTPSHKKMTPRSPILSKKSEFAMPRAEPKLDSMLFNLFSDSSMEGDTIDASEVERRFAALSRGERVPPTSLAALKRRAPLHPKHAPMSLSQVKDDLKNRDRTFFKHKRQDSSKFRKIK